MKYGKIPSNLFINNRKNFINSLKPKSIAIFNSNDIMPTNADGTMGMKHEQQDIDLHTLTEEDKDEF